MNMSYDPLAVENLPDNQVWPKLDFDALTVLECIAGDSVTLLTAADALLHSGDTSIDPVTIPVNKYLVGIGLLRKGIAGIRSLNERVIDPVMKGKQVAAA